MFLLRFLFKLLGVMNSETSARSLAAAVALGSFLGIAPLLSLQGGVALAIVLFFRVNLSLALAATIAALLATRGLDSAFHGLGAQLLEREGLRGFWSTLSNHPVLRLSQCNHTVSLGRTVVAAALFLPAFGLGLALVRVYRTRVEGWLMQTRLFRFLRSLRLYTLYRTFTSPLG